MAEVILKLKLDNEEYERKIDVSAEHAKDFLEGVDDVIEGLGKAPQAATKSINDLEQKLKILTSEMKSADIGSDEFKRLKAEVSGVEKELKDVTKGVEEVEEKTESVAEKAAKWGNIITGINQGLQLAGQIYNVLSKPIGVAAEFERYEVQLGVLLGGVSNAKEKIAELADIGAKTPFQFDELIKMTKQLEVMTRGALTSRESIIMIGDVAAGVGAPLDELGMWFGRLYDGIDSGRPVGEALMRLQELGVISGETRGKIEELQKQNADSTEVWAVVTEAMGRFGGMMDKQSATYEGMASNLEDSVTLMLRNIGDTLLPQTKNFIEEIIPVVESIASVFEKSTDATKRAYNEQKSYVDSIERTMPDLLYEYEKLNSKTNLSTDEQTKLKDIIAKIAEAMPSAITQWDKYGNAIGVSAEKARELMATEKMRLQYVHKDAIEAQEEQLKKYEQQLRVWSETLNRGEETVMMFDVESVVPLTEKRVQQLRSKIKDNQALVEGVKAEIARLKGEVPEIKEDENEDKEEDETKTNYNKELELQKLKKDINEITLVDYKNYLDKRLAMLSHNTEEEKKTYRTFLKEAEAINKELGKSEKDQELERMKLSYDVNEISLDQYKGYLVNRISSLSKNTDEEKKIYLKYLNELKSLDKKEEKKEKEKTETEGFDYEAVDLEIQLIQDKYQKEYALLELWHAKELDAHKDSARKQEAIDRQYLQRKLQLQTLEAEAELNLAKETLTILAGIINNNSAIGQSIAATRAGINTYEGITKALAQGGIWGFAQAALIATEGFKQVQNILTADMPKMKGFADGGIIIGERGPEIIAPADSYAQHQGAMVAKAMMAAQNTLYKLNVEASSNADNSALLNRVDTMNERLNKFLQNPVKAVFKIGKREAKDILLMADESLRGSIG